MEENKETTQEACSCCCGTPGTKHTDRTEAERKKLINRLKRIEGQIRGIIVMLENNAYSNHIHNCVARDIRQGKDETIDELVETLQKMMK